MKITLISNFFNHHQMPLCEGLRQIPGVEFAFVATERVPEERLRMGYGDSFDHLSYYREAVEEQDFADAEQLCFDSDVLICGAPPLRFIRRRLRKKKLTFSYNERMFKNGFWNHPGDVIRGLLWFTRFNNPNFYQLCASAYAGGDSQRIGAFPRRKLRWGYFPEVKRQPSLAVLHQKEEATILWVGRFLDWKHPEKAVEVAKRLKEEGVSFRLSMIGTGEMEETLCQLIKNYGLEQQVFLLGTMSPEQVRRHMERSRVFLVTSDYGEGWGAVLNEAMNSGCAVVASHAIGAAPYLIDQGKNGFIYHNENFEQMYGYIKSLLADHKLAEALGTAAYTTMTQLWNADVAVNRLYAFCCAKLKGETMPVYEDGPLSFDPGLNGREYE